MELNSFPLLPNGKIDKVALKKRLLITAAHGICDEQIRPEQGNRVIKKTPISQKKAQMDMNAFLSDAGTDEVAARKEAGIIKEC